MRMVYYSCYKFRCIARLKFERNEELFTQLRKVCPSAAKHMNETNHIENDYIFQLDPTKFYKIPEVYLDRINDVISGNSQ